MEYPSIGTFIFLGGMVQFEIYHYSIVFCVYIFHTVNLVGLQQGSLAYESKMQGLRLRLISVIFWVNGLAETSGEVENN